MIFGSCTSLKEVNLPSGLTKVGSSMFSYCNSLTHVEIPAGVKSIDYQAFYNCSALESINFPDGLEEIGLSAFMGCTNIKQVNLPNTVHYINSNAFDCCKALNKICLGNQVREIGWEAFEHTTIKEIILPATLQRCGQYMFAYCDELENITVCAKTPPRIENDWRCMVPRNKFSTITLYVPEGCADAYRSAVEWKNFTNIVEKNMETSSQTDGITSPTSSSITQPVLYDLLGRRMTGQPTKGIYIKNGRKVVIK